MRIHVQIKWNLAGVGWHMGPVLSLWPVCFLLCGNDVIILPLQELPFKVWPFDLFLGAGLLAAICTFLLALSVIIHSCKGALIVIPCCVISIAFHVQRLQDVPAQVAEGLFALVEAASRKPRSFNFLTSAYL